jgi:hypothetical protein
LVCKHVIPFLTTVDVTRQIFILNPDLASRTNLPANSELDIKVLDDPHKVADINQNVLTFLQVPIEPRSSIQIVNVVYSIICNTSNSDTSQYSRSTSTATLPSNNPELCPNVERTIEMDF